MRAPSTLGVCGVLRDPGTVAADAESPIYAALDPWPNERQFTDGSSSIQAYAHGPARDARRQRPRARGSSPRVAHHGAARASRRPPLRPLPAYPTSAKPSGCAPGRARSQGRLLGPRSRPREIPSSTGARRPPTSSRRPLSPTAPRGAAPNPASPRAVYVVDGSADSNGDGRSYVILLTPSGSYEYTGLAAGGFTANVWARIDLPLGVAHYRPVPRRRLAGAAGIAERGPESARNRSRQFERPALGGPAGRSGGRPSEPGELRRAARCRMDSPAAKISMGFGAPQEMAHVPGESVDPPQQAQVNGVAPIGDIVPPLPPVNAPAVPGAFC